MLCYENGKVETSEEEQIKLITDHFKKMLAPESQNGNFKEYNPKKNEKSVQYKGNKKSSEVLEKLQECRTR